MIDRIKIRFDVGLDHVGDALLLESPAEGIQTLTWAASRPVAVAAVFENGFEDGLQRAAGRGFDNLVFQIADVSLIRFGGRFSYAA